MIFCLIVFKGYYSANIAKNNKLFYPRITITCGGHAGVSFYKLAEEGLVGEVELFCNFFDGFVGVFQAVFDMLNGCFVD